MEPTKQKRPSITKILGETFREIKKNPRVFTPFVIFAAFEFISLVILYLAPQMPFRLVLGPPIRTLWGEGFLHYPTNFVLLPKLASHARMFLSVFWGSLLTGIAVSIVYKKSTKEAFKKYISLFLIVLLVTLLYFILMKVISLGLLKYFRAGHLKLLFLGPVIWMGPIMVVGSVFFGILIQALFIYAIPDIILGEEKFVRTIAKSFSFFKKNFLLTFLLIGLPMIFYIPIIILNYNTAFLVYKLFPEIIFWVCLFGIIISSLVIDPLVTISTALLYSSKNKK